ncbi:MAG: hypothetical protein ACKPJJ_08905, partial [Planctomycetaceae bacterium]
MFTIAVADVTDEPLVVESIAPVATGSYKAGEILTLRVSLSEIVTVKAKPQLLFKVGAATRKATYVGGNGTASLEFRYKV